MSVNGASPVAENFTSWAVTPTLSELVQRMVTVSPGRKLSLPLGKRTRTVGVVTSRMAMRRISFAMSRDPRRSATRTSPRRRTGRFRHSP